MSSNKKSRAPNSSPCSIGESESVYRGYLLEDEVLEFLNTLLEAERAGAKVCQSTLKEINDASRIQLLISIKRDEVASCQGLIGSIRIMGAEPSVNTGDFYEKCMVISDIKDRIRMLNKGQRWVVRKITETLPEIVNKHVQMQLKEMLKMHEKNVSLIDSVESI